MPSTYTTNNGIELPATGEQSGTWGDTVNTNMSIVDRLVTGVGTITLSGTTHTLTTTSGTLSDGMYRVLVFSGSPSGTNTVTISPNTQQKYYIVKNSSGQSVVLTQGSGGNVTVANGDVKIVYANGGGASAAVVDLTADLAMSSVNITGGTITGITDLALADGGTGASLTASNGGILYSTATVLAVLAGTATAGQMLRSGASGAPSWSTATYPDTTTINQLLYSSSGNTVAGLATANTAALVTSSSGVPAFASGATANRVLRTDGLSVSFAQVALTTDVTGVLPTANGGTGSSFFAVSGPSVARTYTFPDSAQTIAALGVNQSFTVAQRGSISALTDGATITPDFNAANNYSLTIGGARTLANPTNLTAGQSGAIVITQDGTGGRTLAFGTYWKFPGGTTPTLTTTASAVDVLVYYVESTTRITATMLNDVK